jgi:hypothetical protein
MEGKPGVIREQGQAKTKRWSDIAIGRPCKQAK